MNKRAWSVLGVPVDLSDDSRRQAIDDPSCEALAEFIHRVVNVEVFLGLIFFNKLNWIDTQNDLTFKEGVVLGKYCIPFPEFTRYEENNIINLIAFSNRKLYSKIKKPETPLIKTKLIEFYKNCPFKIDFRQHILRERARLQVMIDLLPTEEEERVPPLATLVKRSILKQKLYQEELEITLYTESKEGEVWEKVFILNALLRARKLVLSEANLYLAEILKTF